MLETGAIVAVKIIPLTEQDEISSIQKEIGMLRDCQHPNVVNYYVRRRCRLLPLLGAAAAGGGPATGQSSMMVLALVGSGTAPSAWVPAVRRRRRPRAGELAHG